LSAEPNNLALHQMRSLSFLICFALSSWLLRPVSVCAQSEMPETLADPHQIILPFQRVGNLILIEAQVDTFKGNFILDTGAPGLVLNRTWFRDYGQLFTGDGMGITGGTTTTYRTVVGKFKLDGIQDEEVEADVIDLGHIENARGVPIYGLLGVSIFKGYEIIIDYPNNVLYLLELDRKGMRKSLQGPVFNGKAEKVPIQLVNNTILLWGEIGGKKLRFSLDTGAETNVLHNRVPDAVLQEVQITRRAMLSGTGNKKVEVLGGQIQRLRIGQSDYKDVRTIVTNLSNISRAYSLSIDGMIGHDFLSLGVVSINFVRKELTLYSSPIEMQP